MCSLVRFTWRVQKRQIHRDRKQTGGAVVGLAGGNELQKTRRRKLQAIGVLALDCDGAYTSLRLLQNQKNRPTVSVDGG